MATVHDQPTSPWAYVGIGIASAGVLAVLAAMAGAHVTSLALHGHPARGVGAERMGALVTSGGDPVAAWGPESGVSSPVMFWLVLGAVLVASGIGAYKAWVWYRPRRDRATFRRVPGMGARWRALREVGARATVRAGSSVLPESVITKPDQAGVAVGRLGSRRVFASVEDSGLIIGPPRCGKGVSLVIPMVLDAPGAVVVTGTRPETVAVTRAARKRIGPVAVFDPQNLTGLPPRLRWSLIAGCEDSTKAKVRASGMAEATSVGKGAGNESHWKAETAGICALLLHAAALGKRTPADLYMWSTGPGAARPALDILNADAASERGWADALRGVLDGDARYRDNAWAGIRQAFAPLSTGRVQELVNPGPGDRLDPVEFTQQRGTLYILGTASGSGPAKPLISALLNDFAESNRVHAATTKDGGRLDPPLMLMLDEIVSLAKPPDIPGLLADGGGSGISTWIVIQSLSQLETAWGPAEKQAIMDTAAWWLVFGGLKSKDDVALIGDLAGQRRVQRTSRTTSGTGLGQASTQSSHDVVPVLDPATIRAIPKGQVLASIRNTGLHALDVGDWRTRPDSAALQRDRAATYSTIRANADPDAARVIDVRDAEATDAPTT